MATTDCACVSTERLYSKTEFGIVDVDDEPGVALQIQDRSQKSRPVSSLNQSQTQMTRPVATDLALQRYPDGCIAHTTSYCRCSLRRSYFVLELPVDGKCLRQYPTEYQPTSLAAQLTGKQ